MKVFSIYLIITLTFLSASLFNSHPHKNDFKANFESKNQTLETLLKDF